MIQSQFDQLLQDILSEDHLPERQWVWAVESDEIGRLCCKIIHATSESFIAVMESEEEALRWINGGNWACPPTGCRPIKMSYDAAVAQATEQGPSPIYKYPCRGIVLEPQFELVRVEGKTEGPLW